MASMNPTHPSTPKPTGVSAEPKSAPNAPAAQEDSFAAMLEASFNAPKPKEGTLISGTIVRITDKVLIVDVGYKSEGILPVDEVKDAAGVVPFKVGDTIEALVERLSLGTGDVLLSIKRAKQLKAWDRLEAAHLSGEPVEGVVVEKTRGGLFVDIDGVRAFLPGSLTDVRRRSLDDFLNRAVTVKVIKLNKKSQNIVVSRKEIVEVEEEHRRSQLAEQLQSGVVLHGTVKNLTEFGAFIDVGGLDGLLRLGDMSWGKVKHPSEMFQTGQEIEVVVLKFDAKKCKLDLGFKQRLPNPWESAVERFPVGARVKGKVSSITDFGAFVELEPGLEGLIHISEMSWTKKLKHPSEILKEGDSLEALILEVDPTSRRLRLGLRQLEPNPWDLVGEKYRAGVKATGTVKTLTDFGAFIELEPGIDGLVHITDLSRRKIGHPNEVLKPGQSVEVMVTKIDLEQKRIGLSMKELEPDGFELFFNSHNIGDTVTGPILRIKDGTGIFVDLGQGNEALIRTGDLTEKVDVSLETQFKVGEPITGKLSKMDPIQRKLQMAVITPTAVLEAQAVSEFKKQKEEETKRHKEAPSGSLGDVLSGAFSELETQFKNKG
jgi:small subunit ribosomal protein S1